MRNRLFRFVFFDGYVLFSDGPDEHVAKAKAILHRYYNCDDHTVVGFREATQEEYKNEVGI